MSAVLSPQAIEPQVVNTSSAMLPLSAERKEILLKAVVRTGGNITRAARLLGTTRQNIYRWAQTDPVFAELFNEALEAGTDNLEERVYERAMDTSDRLAEFLLRARRPEKYRETYKLETDITSVNLDQLAESFLNACTEAARRRQEQAAQPVPLLPASSTPNSET